MRASDNEPKRMKTSGHFGKSSFCEQCFDMNILKTKMLFLITPEVNANSSSRYIKSLFIHSLSLDVPLACLCINHPK